MDCHESKRRKLEKEDKDDLIPIENRNEYICSYCAARNGWKLPNNFVTQAVRARCPSCGNVEYLIKKICYSEHGKRKEKK